MPDARPTRIVVVDDHEILRRGIVQLLQDAGDFEVVGEASSAARAHEVIGAQEPDLVIADLVLDDGPDGIQLTKALKAQRPFLPVLLLSAHDESLFAERALDAGASGYVMKDEAVDALLDAIRVVVDGGIWLSADMRSRLEGAKGNPGVELPTAEASVLREMQSGNWTTVGLSRKLGASRAEVERLRSSLRAMLGLRTDVELVLFAHRQPRGDAAS